MCNLDGDTADFWHVTRPIARKPHRCGECGRTIGAGETYVRSFGVHEGSGYTLIVCRHCQIACQWLTENCGGWASGLRDEMREHAEEYPALAWGLLRVAAGIMRGWKRFDGAGLMPVAEMPRAIVETIREAA